MADGGRLMMTMMIRSVGFAIFLILLGVMLALITRAMAHGEYAWIAKAKLYDPWTKVECCGPNDCARIKPPRVTAKGYELENGETIPAGRLIPKSRDGRWWRCEIQTGPGTGLTRCLIGPPPGV